MESIVLTPILVSSFLNGVLSKSSNFSSQLLSGKCHYGSLTPSDRLPLPYADLSP